MKEKITVALIYDFDGTLAPGNMQEYDFIPAVGKSNMEFWNEANTLRQPIYSTFGAQLTLRLKELTITLWGRNLTNTDYDVFYFKSVGKEFFSKGAPIHGGIRLNINL